MCKELNFCAQIYLFDTCPKLRESAALNNNNANKYVVLTTITKFYHFNFAPAFNNMITTSALRIVGTFFCNAQFSLHFAVIFAHHLCHFSKVLVKVLLHLDFMLKTSDQASKIQVHAV